ncbi:MAG: o-succinylbenzoate synthase [Carboxylicivirga sp.]|jgi:o-succinylbenzoate synthase|nr:o-succinylbenzoate synthase [Carboxylicivirga sp.]
MYKAEYIKRTLIFNEAGGTSRGTLYEKPSWFIRIYDEKGRSGMGECSIIPGLSKDDPKLLENKIKEVCRDINNYLNTYHESLLLFPALRFAIEMAMLDLNNNRAFELFPSEFTRGNDSITINGLIWMGSANEMLKRIDQKLQRGFTCLKLKVGAIDFNEELKILQAIRSHYSNKELELRVDANGAFSPTEALVKLEALSKFDLHSIEQPIMAGQAEAMQRLCDKSPIDIALDEELIGINGESAKLDILETIQPQYIILKPSLLGGFQSAEEWIRAAEHNGIRWWATSALEGNVGLNAIAQWVFKKQNPLKQGLGTGQVFSNNIQSPLYLMGEQLYYDKAAGWTNPFDS